MLWRGHQLAGVSRNPAATRFPRRPFLTVTVSTTVLLIPTSVTPPPITGTSASSANCPATTHSTSPMSDRWGFTFGAKRREPARSRAGQAVGRILQYPNPTAIHFGFATAPRPVHPSDVNWCTLYRGLIFGALPFNAVAQNALFQPLYQQTVFNSIYHWLQAKFTHRFSHGLQMQAAYT